MIILISEAFSTHAHNILFLTISSRMEENNQPHKFILLNIIFIFLRDALVTVITGTHLLKYKLEFIVIYFGEQSNLPDK